MCLVILNRITDPWTYGVTKEIIAQRRAKRGEGNHGPAVPVVDLYGKNLHVLIGSKLHEVGMEQIYALKRNQHNNQEAHEHSTANALVVPHFVDEPHLPYQ